MTFIDPDLPPNEVSNMADLELLWLSSCINELDFLFSCQQKGDIGTQCEFYGKICLNLKYEEGKGVRQWIRVWN